LIGIAGEHLGREEFTEKFWKGELFFDLGKKTWFPAIHGGKKYSNTAAGIWQAMTGGAVGRALKRVQGKKIEGNLKGEGTVLGGVWVVHPQQGVLYEYREKSWGDSVTENDLTGLMEAIKSAHLYARRSGRAYSGRAHCRQTLRPRRLLRCIEPQPYLPYSLPCCRIGC